MFGNNDYDETYVDGNSLLQQMSSQTYTMQNLFEDCAQKGRKVLQDHQSGKQHTVARGTLAGTLDTLSVSDSARLGKPETYRAVFLTMARELEEAAESLVPIAIPHFGTFGYRMFNLGITIPFFDLNPKFSDKYKLVRNNKKSLHQRGGGDNKNQPILQRLNVQRCAKLTKMPHSLYKAVLQGMWARLGRVMGTGAVVDIDFLVGTLSSEDQCPTFEFTQRLDPLPHDKFTGLRTTLSNSTSTATRHPDTGRVHTSTMSTISTTSTKALPRVRQPANSGHAPPSLARIPQASRTVRVARQAQAAQAAGAMQFDLGRKKQHRGGTGTGYYKPKAQPGGGGGGGDFTPQPPTRGKTRAPFFGEGRAIVEVVDVEGGGAAFASSSSSSSSSSPTSRLTYGVRTHGSGHVVDVVDVVRGGGWMED